MSKAAGPFGLTEGEVVALRLLGEGLTPQQIGRRVGASRAAVQKRMDRARTKLGAQTAHQAMVICCRIGVIPVEVGRGQPE